MRFRPALLCALTVALLLAPLSTQSAQLQAIRIASSPADGIVPVLYAQQNGSFAKVGLDVSVTKMGGGAVISGVMGGALDIGKSSGVAIILAHAKGIPLML